MSASAFDFVKPVVGSHVTICSCWHGPGPAFAEFGSSGTVLIRARVTLISLTRDIVRGRMHVAFVLVQHVPEGHIDGEYRTLKDILERGILLVQLVCRIALEWKPPNMQEGFGFCGIQAQL